MHALVIPYTIISLLPDKEHDSFRNVMDCPYPGCKKKDLKKLSLHLMAVHHIKDRLERKRLLQSAKEVNSNIVYLTHIYCFQSCQE